MSDESPLLTLALAMYTGEPCGVCGVDLDMAAARKSVFTGYRQMPDGRTSRCSHGACWEGLTEDRRAEIIADAERERASAR